MLDRDDTDALIEQVSVAIRDKSPLKIGGGNTKAFYGLETSGTVLSTRQHCGIVSYEPNELVLTARAGTPLAEVEKALADNGQMLPFEPPSFGVDATLGGTIACNLSGPRRPYAGSARDFLLGTTIVNGRGERLRFGGEVMKNVAGYDVSRLMAGSFGTLGVILEASLKVLPRPAKTTTVVLLYAPTKAIEQLNKWAGQPLPISATCYGGDSVYVRLEGAATAVDKSRRLLGGEEIDGNEFWRKLREQEHDFFDSKTPLWRIAVAPATPPLSLQGKSLIEWNVAQLWLLSDAEPIEVRNVVSAAGGHAILFKNGNRAGDVFQPLASGVNEIHRRLKLALDPHGIFNPGRMYRDL